MTHEVLPHVVDVASPKESIDDVGRIEWRPVMLLELYMLHRFMYIYSCVLNVYVVGRWMISSLL